MEGGGRSDHVCVLFVKKGVCLVTSFLLGGGGGGWGPLYGASHSFFYSYVYW